MKKSILLLVILAFASSFAQDSKNTALVTVMGEGKIKIVPDQVVISLSIETKGTETKAVKEQNDAKTAAVLKGIKKWGLAPADVQTQRVSLQPSYDYETKKTFIHANQSISLLLRDLSKYDGLMTDMVTAGITNISSVVFQSSQQVKLQSSVRKLAMQNAVEKAQDYLSVVGQKVGKVQSISDTAVSESPRPFYNSKMTAMQADGAPRETLAAGELELSVQIQVSFVIN
ncbi:MAG: SIMPL domain-containing protein [Flavobacterium psychrophilum]